MRHGRTRLFALLCLAGLLVLLAACAGQYSPPARSSAPGVTTTLLKDSLKGGPQSKAGWDTNQNCRFTDTGYVVSAPATSKYVCFANASNVQASDTGTYTYSVDMTFPKGMDLSNGAGILFGGNKEISTYILFLIHGDGSYELQSCQHNDCQSMAAADNGSSLKQFKSETKANTLSVSVQKNTFVISVNGQRAAWIEHPIDEQLLRGQIGLLAESGDPSPMSATFTNMLLQQTS